MADTAQANAAMRRDLVAAEINALQQRLDELRREAKHIDEWLAGYEFFSKMLPSDDVQGPPRPMPRPAPPPKRNPPREVVADFAYMLIESRAQPQSRAAVMQALPEVGLEINGKDPDMILSTMLWRSKDKIVRLKNYGYWMADKDFPEADYWVGFTDPERDDGADNDDGDDQGAIVIADEVDELA